MHGFERQENVQLWTNGRGEMENEDENAEDREREDQVGRNKAPDRNEMTEPVNNKSGHYAGGVNGMKRKERTKSLT